MKKIALILGALIIAGALTTACSEKESTGVYTDVPEFSVGTASSEGYESAWSGIKFTVADGITMADDAELAELAELGDGASYEMMAYDDEGFDTVLVRCAPMEADMSFEEYLEVQHESITAQYSSNGLSVTHEEVDDAMFGGRAYKGTLYTVSMDGGVIYQRLYRAMLGDRVCEVYFTYMGASTFETLLGCFGK